MALLGKPPGSNFGSSLPTPAQISTAPRETRGDEGPSSAAAFRTSFEILRGREEKTNARAEGAESPGMRQHRYIIASSTAPGTFLLVRANASDDGTVLSTGSRSLMVALRDQLLRTEARERTPEARPRLRSIGG